MGCFQSSSSSDVSQITAYLNNDGNSITLLDKFHKQTGKGINTKVMSRFQTDNKRFSDLFERKRSNPITFNKKLSFSAYLEDWEIQIDTIDFKVSSYAPFQLFVYGYYDDRWELIISHIVPQKQYLQNHFIFTQKNMPLSVVNKMFRVIGIKIIAPDDNCFILDQFYVYGKMQIASLPFPQKALSGKIGDNGDDSIGEGNEVSHSRKETVYVCDACRLTCICCKKFIDLANPGKQGYICSNCYDSTYENRCYICHKEIDQRNVGYLCHDCTVATDGSNKCAECQTEFDTSV